MKFRPLHDRVVVKRVEEDTKTKGGIIIPDTAKEKPQEGEVIAVGPGGRSLSFPRTPGAGVVSTPSSATAKLSPVATGARLVDSALTVRLTVATLESSQSFAL